MEEVILITQGAGHIGLLIARSLVKTKTGNKKIRGGYSADKQHRLEDLQQTGAEPVKFDLEDPAAMTAALQNVKTVVLIPPFKNDRDVLCNNFIDKCTQSGVQHIVLISIQEAYHQSFPWAQEMFRVEQKLINSGMKYTILRSAIHYETILLEKEALKKNTLFLPTGEHKFPPVSYADVSELANKVVNKLEDSTNKIFEVTGPELLNGYNMANMFVEKLFKPVRFISTTVQDYKDKLKSWGVPEVKAESLGDFLDWYQRGNGTRIHTEYSTILGRNPEMFKEFLLRYKDEIIG